MGAACERGDGTAPAGAHAAPSPCGSRCGRRWGGSAKLVVEMEVMMMLLLVMPVSVAAAGGVEAVVVIEAAAAEAAIDGE